MAIAGVRNNFSILACDVSNKFLPGCAASIGHAHFGSGIFCDPLWVLDRQLRPPIRNMHMETLIDDEKRKVRVSAHAIGSSFVNAFVLLY
jgi:hypothetical protein